MTLLKTADATQVSSKRKDRDSCESDNYAQADDLRKRRRCRSLDGLRVCPSQQVAPVILCHDHVFVKADEVAVKAFEGPRAEMV